MIFEFVSERLIPRGEGYLSSTSCHYDHNITVLIKRSDTCCGYLSDGRAHVYFFSRLSIRPNLSPSSISSRGNFTLELPRIAHWFRFFFGGEEGRDKLNSAARRCRARSSAFSAAVLRVPLCIFPRGKKSERGGKGERQSGGQRERKERKKEGREGGKKRAKNRRILCSQPDLPPLPAPPLSLGEMKKRSVRSTGHSPNILEATTTAHPIRPLFSLFFPLFFVLFSFFSFLLSPPSLFPYAPPFVRALSRVFDYENLVLRGRRVQPRSCIPRNDDRQGRIRLSDFNSCEIHGRMIRGRERVAGREGLG